MAGGGLGGFLFGNIDEEGRLDDDELDEELKASLTSFVEKGFGDTSGVFNVAGLEVDELATGKGGVPCNSAKRIDEDEEMEEMFEEVERVNNGIEYEEASTQQTLTAALPRRSIQFTSLFSLGQQDKASSGMAKLKRVRVKRRFLGNKVFHYADDSTALLRSVTSVPSQHAIPSRHRLFIAHITGVGTGLSFGAIRRGRQPVKVRLLEAAFEHYSSDAPLYDVPSLHDGDKINPDSIGNSQLHPIQVMEWEDEIIWSDSDTPKPSKLAPMFAEVRTEPPPPPRPQPGIRQFPVIPPGVSRAQGTLPGSTGLGPSAATLSALASVAPAALSALIAQQRRFSPSPQPPGAAGPQGRLIKNTATRVPNLEILLKDDWLESIIWDEACPPPPSYPAHLIFNMNDLQLILEAVPEQPAEMAAAARKFVRPERGVQKRSKKIGASAMTRPQAITNYSRPVVDRFNLSNDKFYEARPVVQKSSTASASDGKVGVSGRTGLQHSIPALKLLPPHFSTFRDKPELRSWHRPGLSVPTGRGTPQFSFSAYKQRKKKSSNRVAQVIRNSRKLTLRDGAPFLVVEFAEEFPLLMQNPGMSSHVLLYYRKRSTKDPFIPTDPYGLVRLLEPTDPSPLWTFGDVPSGQTLYILSNNLFKAPLFPHTPPRLTDFLIVKNTDKNGVIRWYLREIGPIFLAGQVFPLVEIFGPHSRKHNQYCRSRLQVAAYRLFQKDTNERKRLRATRLSRAFPQFSDGSIRKWLKEYAESARAGNESGTWLLKSDAPSLGEDELRALVTPEMVCVYEAMLAGQQRLIDSGLIKPSSVVADSSDHRHIGEESIADETESAAGTSERPSTRHPTAMSHAPTAPWNMTAAFLATVTGSGMVRLEGQGDPSGHGDMFSFVKGAPPSLQVSKITDDSSSLADVFRRSRNSAELQTLYNQEKRKIWERQVKALSSRDATTTAFDVLVKEPPSIAAEGTKTKSRHRLVIERTIVSQSGETELQLEEIDDPKVAALYLKQRRLSDIRRKRRANAAIATAAVKSRKRPREDRPVKPAVPKKEINVKCGACGAIGHMRTNRICPFFKGDDEAFEVALSEPAVKMEGTKLSINPEALNRIVEQERSFKFKIALGSALAAAAKPSSSPSPPPVPRKKRLSPCDAFLNIHPDKKEALSAFNSKLVAILDKLMDEPDSWPFHRPVSRRDYPHYYRLIARPIDLSTIRSQAAKAKFLRTAEFIAKIQLMANNCLQFNRADHVFTGSAFRLLDIARNSCSEADVVAAENALHENPESGTPTVPADDHSGAQSDAELEEGEVDVDQ